MNAKVAKKMLSVILGFLLITVPSQYGFGYQTSASSPAVGGSTETTPKNASQLQALVAPIALYPDALVAQVLAASTFPDQVAIANYWLQQNKSLTGNFVDAGRGQAIMGSECEGTHAVPVGTQ